MANNLALRILIHAKDLASAAINKVRGGVREFGREVKQLGPLDRVVQSTFANIKSYILSAFAVAGVVQFTRRISETVRVIQDLRIRLSGLTSSALDYAKSQAYLVNLAGRYHKQINALTSSFASLLALENAGVITRQQAILLLQGFSNAATKTGASQDQMSQSTYGLAQALSTGIVAMEEFKQITEPMPGLANEIAKAFGVTVGELRVLIGTGTVASEEFGRKFVQALKAYEGAAERAGGTVSASYADIENAYNQMALALEKPVASALLDVIDLGKSTFGWIKDNSGAIVGSLELIAATLAGKVLSSLSSVTGGYFSRFRAESSARASAIALAKADAALAAGNAELAASNLVLVQSDLRAEAAKLAQTNATIAAARAQVAALQATIQTTSITYLLRNAVVQLTAAEANRAALLSNMAALGRQQAAVSAQIAAAQTAQATSMAALTAATATSTVAMSRAAVAGRAAFALIGGWVGVGVVALYGLYKVLGNVTDAEGRAAVKAKALADAIALSNAEVAKLSAAEVDIDFAKTQADIDAVNAKIKEVESFSVGKLFNLSDLSAQRANLLQTLDVLKQRKDALVNQKNDQIINFDASALSADELTAALNETKAKIVEITNRVEPLRQQVADGLIGSEAINADLLALNAYEAKLSALQAATGKSVQSQQQMQKAFKAVQEAAKDLTANIDALAKLQTAAIEQSLTERLAAIDAADTSEAEKARLRTNAQLDSYKIGLALQQQAGADKLKLIDQTYARELAANIKNAAQTRALETEKRQAKLAVYTGLAEYYQGEVARLSGVYASEYQLAQQAKQQLLALNQSHEQALFQIKLLGLDEEHKLSAQRSEFDRLTYEAKKEQAKGELADQEKINRLLTDAKGLNSAITAAAGTGSSQIYQAKSRENQLYEIQKKELEATAKAHEDNAAKAKTAQQTVQAELTKTNAAVTEITDKLNKDYALKIGIDLDSLTSAQTAIDALTAPATKVITVVTQNAGGGDVPAQNPAVPGFAAGTRLPGFGGGDQWPALLESGEGVANKHAMRALDKAFGPAFFDGLNAGKNPVELLRSRLGTLKLASGGRVSIQPKINMPRLSIPMPNMPKLAAAGGQSSGGDIINITLPGAGTFGPFHGSKENASALAEALNMEVLKRGRRAR